jgi:hypothetical protein
LKGQRNPYFKYLGIDPIERIPIMSPFRVNAEIVEDAGDVRVGSHKDPISVLELTVEIRGKSSKILFLRSIIKGKDCKV